MFIVRLWRAAKRLYAFLLPIRFSVIALAVLLFAFLFSDQGSDILRALAEDHDQPGTFPRLLMLILASNLLAYAIWYWSRQMLRFRPDETYAGLPQEFGELTRWLPRVAGFLVFVIEIAGFGHIGFKNAAERTTMLWWAIGLLLLSALIYLLIVIKRHAMFHIEDKKYVRAATFHDFFGTTGAVLLATLVIEVILFIWATVNPVSWWILGAAAVLVITIGVWVPFGSFLVALGEYWRFPILGALLVWALAISCWNDNHKIRTAGALPATRPTVEAAFDAWYERMSARYPSGDIPVIVVATEGGGIRAAYWTSTALTVLQDQIPMFADHCFAISGVSGGALGAAMFDSLLVQRVETAGAPQRRTLHGDSRAALDFDALSGTLAAMAQPDLLQRFIPFPFLPDRAAALEKGWEYGWFRAFRGTAHEHLFGEGFLATMQKHPALPLLMLNGTMVETGDRIVTGTAHVHPSLRFRNAFDAFEQLDTDIPISTASLMSARFTYLSPAGRIPNHHPQLKRAVFGHVIDGGYFENSGGVTAGEVVNLVWQKRQLEHKRVVPFVIVIDYFDVPKQAATVTRPFCPAPGVCGAGAPNTVEKFANELLSPLRGLLSTRGARGSQAVGDLVEMAGSDPRGVNYVELRLLPRTVPLPLGWVLSEQAQDSIDTAMDCEGGNRTAVRLVAQRLGYPLPFDWRDSVAVNIRQKAGLPPCTASQDLPPVNCNRAGCGDPTNTKDVEK